MPDWWTLISPDKQQHMFVSQPPVGIQVPCQGLLDPLGDGEGDGDGEGEVEHDDDPALLEHDPLLTMFVVQIP